MIHTYPPEVDEQQIACSYCHGAGGECQHCCNGYVLAAECQPVSDDPFFFCLEMAYDAALRGMDSQPKMEEIEKWLGDALSALGEKRKALRLKHEEEKSKANGGM